MILNIITITLKLLGAYTMFHFSRPKLLGLPISVKSFTLFGEVLNINGKSFMHFTGGLELITALVLVASIFIGGKTGNWISISGFALLLGTMVGALVTEYFIRETPVPMLVSIAVTMCLIAISQLIIKII